MITTQGIEQKCFHCGEPFRAKRRRLCCSMECYEKQRNKERKRLAQQKPSGYAMAAQRAGEAYDAKVEDELDGRLKAWYRLQRMKLDRKVKESRSGATLEDGDGD